MIPALIRCRKDLQAVRVDRTRVRPKVSIIGEFWAMTTVTAWILFLIWAGHYDTRKRMSLREADSGRHGLKGENPALTLGFTEETLPRGSKFTNPLGATRHFVACTAANAVYDMPMGWFKRFSFRTKKRELGNVKHS